AIESAHKQWDTIRSRLDVKQTTHQGLEEQFKVIVDDNRGLENETLDAVKQRYRQTNTLVEGLQKQVERLTAKNADLENTSASIKQLDADLKAANQALNQLTSASAAAATELESQRSAVPEAYRDLHELEKTLSETTKNKEKLESEINSIKTRYQNSRDQKVAAESELKSATVNEKEANKKREQLQTTWESILNESPFDNEQHFINASMERAEQNRLQEEIQRFDNDLLLATNQVTDKENATLEKKRPDLQLLQENEQKALQSKELVQQQVSQTQLKLESLNNTKKQFLDFVDQQTALETQYGTVGRLSDVSNGNNSNNLNLQRFVLSVLLDDVLQEANVRLQKMSQGRYRLYRSEEVEDRRSKAGLDLIVDDTHTGEPRAVTTLSGGESFQAALALALGLSDVVQAYAGGIRLDTLFIDEGFGSLDATSLDLAINTLLDLQKTGRMVGVISHVQEMKQMLSVRLDVNSDRGRSHTQWVGV
ncbi:MAG: hypothetical protein OEZ58_12000, partial [Gammaproteobacteria bacterium]|nr:hypothetical protein [Gammaproteobacteria bacterium]